LILVSFTTSIGVLGQFSYGLLHHFSFWVSRTRGKMRLHDLYLWNQVGLDSLIVFLLSFSWLSPFFFLSRFSFFYQFLPTHYSPFSLPLSSCPAFTQGLNSLSLSLSLSHTHTHTHALTHVQRDTLCWFGLSFCWKGGREERHATVADNFGKGKGHLLSLSLHLYSPLNEVGCLGLV
jgi:hypothetical protein